MCSRTTKIGPYVKSHKNRDTIGFAVFTADGKLVFIKKDGTYAYENYAEYLLYIHRSDDEKHFNTYPTEESPKKYRKIKATLEQKKDLIRAYLLNMTKMELSKVASPSGVKQTRQGKRLIGIDDKDGDDLLDEIYHLYCIQEIVTNILILPHIDNFQYNQYYLPSGRPDKNDKTQLDTAKREVKEEIDVEIHDNLIIRNPDSKLHIHTFKDRCTHCKVIYRHLYYFYKSQFTDQNFREKFVIVNSRPRMRTEVTDIKTVSYEELVTNFKTHQFFGEYVNMFDEYKIYDSLVYGGGSREIVPSNCDYRGDTSPLYTRPFYSTSPIYSVSDKNNYTTVTSAGGIGISQQLSFVCSV